MFDEAVALSLDVSRAIPEGDAAEVAAEADDPNYGMSESGDQDELGRVLNVWVGIAKTSGKLIATMTESVYT